MLKLFVLSDLPMIREITPLRKSIILKSNPECSNGLLFVAPYWFCAFRTFFLMTIT